nr:MAG TPA: hypothetical protein [Caudoviricetes sp.]
MLYSVHDDDGRIIMSNQVFDAEGYDKRLLDHGYKKFVADMHPGLRSHDHWFVQNKGHVKRPKMWVMVDKICIKAGGNDAAVFRGITKGVRLNIFGAGTLLHDLVMDDAELQLHIPVPCTYRVTFEKWPYRSKLFEIEAVA